MTKLDSGIEMVTANALAYGDQILLDCGTVAEVRGTEMAGSKDHLRINLRSRSPIICHGYWRPMIRRVHKADRNRQHDPDRGCYHCFAFTRQGGGCKPLNRVVSERDFVPKTAPEDCPPRVEGARVEAWGGIILTRKTDG